MMTLELQVLKYVLCWRTPGEAAAIFILVASDSWIKIIRNRYNSEIAVYFREPEFNVLDREFLAYLGHRIIESPLSHNVRTKE